MRSAPLRRIASDKLKARSEFGAGLFCLEISRRDHAIGATVDAEREGCVAFLVNQAAEADS